MQKQNLPTYAIVELLIRLEGIDTSVGSYKDHSFFSTSVVVKTSGGCLTFSHQLIMQQFEHPEEIGDDELRQLLSAFKSRGSV